MAQNQPEKGLLLFSSSACLMPDWQQGFPSGSPGASATFILLKHMPATEDGEMLWKTTKLTHQPPSPSSQVLREQRSRCQSRLSGLSRGLSLSACMCYFILPLRCDDLFDDMGNLCSPIRRAHPAGSAWGQHCRRVGYGRQISDPEFPLQPQPCSSLTPSGLNTAAALERKNN